MNVCVHIKNKMSAGTSTSSSSQILTAAPVYYDDLPIQMSTVHGVGKCFVPCCPSGFNFRNKSCKQRIPNYIKPQLTPEHHMMFPVPMVCINNTTYYNYTCMCTTYIILLYNVVYIIGYVQSLARL